MAEAVNLRSKSMDWFLYDNGLRHERVKNINIKPRQNFTGSYKKIWFCFGILFVVSASFSTKVVKSVFLGGRRACFVSISSSFYQNQLFFTQVTFTCPISIIVTLRKCEKCSKLAIKTPERR